MEVWKPLSSLKTFEPMNTQTKHYRKRRSRGFTLLEIVIALGLMGMLVGMIFRVARTSVQLSQMVVETQTVTMEKNAFFNLLQHHFENMPGNAIIRLASKDSRNGDVTRSLFTLTFQNVPMSFDWGDTPITAEAVELVTVEQRDGFVDVILKFINWESLAPKIGTFPLRNSHLLFVSQNKTSSTKQATPATSLMSNAEILIVSVVGISW